MTLTPEQFNKLALKEDLVLAKEEIMSEVGEKLDLILTAVDGLAKKVDDIEHAFVSNQAAHDRFEQRIATIEKHLNINPYSFSAK